MEYLVLNIFYRFFYVSKWEYLDKEFVVNTFLNDLSKASDCVWHDLNNAKIKNYGFNKDAFCYMFSYLKDWKQCA